jgi:hypothetical protein
MDYRAERLWPKPANAGVRVDLLGGEKPAFAVQLHSTVDGQPAPFTDATVDLRGKAVPGVPADGRWHRVTVRLAGTRVVVLLDDVAVFDGQNKCSPTGGWRVHNAVDPSMAGAAAPTEIDDVLIRHPARSGT